MRHSVRTHGILQSHSHSTRQRPIETAVGRVVEALEQRRLMTAPPAPWIDLDIGTTGGSASYSGSTFTTVGKGNDIGSTSDQFNYCYQPSTGNGTIVAKVQSETTPDVRAKAGVMIRDSLLPDAKFVDVVILPGTTTTSLGAAFGRRSISGGGYGSTPATGVAPPEYVKLERSGDIFTGSISLNGSTWTPIGSVTIPMSAGSIQYVGLCNTSHTTTATETATFDNVAVTPATPSALSVSGRTDTSLTLNWTDVNGESAYNIYRSTDGVNYPSTPTATKPADATTFVDTGLSPVTPYYYKVTAANAAGESIAATVNASTVPVAPNLTATRSSSQPTSVISLSWNGVVGATSYTLQRQDLVTQAWTTLNSSIMGTSYTDGGLYDGTQYTYQLWANSDVGPSAASAPAAAITNLNSPGSSVAVDISETPLQSAATTLLTATVSWDGNKTSRETGYSIERSENGGTFLPLGSVPVGQNSFIDTTLTPTAVQVYHVHSYNSVATSSDSTLTVDRLAPIAQEVTNSLNDLDVELRKAKTSQSFTLRNLARSALEVLVTNASSTYNGVTSTPLQRAETYINRLFELQTQSTGDPTKDGSFPWNIDPTPGNLNTDPEHSTCFIAAYLGAVFERYGSQFSAATRSAWKAHVVDMTKFLKQYNPNSDGVSYVTTNIWLQDGTALLTLGEALGDSNIFADTSDGDIATASGISKMNGFVAWTQARGITEYDSPIYYAVDLNALALAYNSLNKTGNQTLLKGVLDYYADDIAANYFAGQHTLAGAHSRDEDFVFGKAGLDYWLSAEGIVAAMPDTTSTTLYSDGEGAFINARLAPATGHPIWHVGADAIKFARMSTKIVHQIYNSQVGRDKYTYVTPDFAIGSSGDYTDPQDKQLNVQLAQSGPTPLPGMAVVMDEYDSPYGAKHATDAGFSKPLHLKDQVTTVQDKGDVLALFDLKPEFAANPTHLYSSIAENVILPNNADKYYVNGVSYTGVGAFNAAATALSALSATDVVVAVQQGDAIVAYRPFLVSSIGGFTAKTQLKNYNSTLDPANAVNAGRLVMYAYSGVARTFNSVSDVCRFGLLVSAAKVSTINVSTFLAALKSANLNPSGYTNYMSGTTWGANLPAGTTGTGSLALFARRTTSALNNTDRTVGGANYWDTVVYGSTTYNKYRFTFSDGSTTRDMAHEILDTLPGSFS